jgi:hypothetical protein
MVGRRRRPSGDDEVGADIVAQGRVGRDEARRAGDIGVGNAVDGGGGGRDRLARIDQGDEGRLVGDAPLDDPDRRHLDDARAVGIEAGGLGVDDDGIEADEGNGGIHGIAHLPRSAV